MELSKPAAGKAWFKALVLAAILLAGYWVYEKTDYKQYLTREIFVESTNAMRLYAEKMGSVAYVSFVCVSAAAIIAYIPALVVIYFSVTIFGALQGALLSALSIYLAITAVYFIAKWLGRDLVIRLAGRRLEKFESRLSGRGLWAVLYLRLFFFVLPPTNWLLGLSSIRFRDVFWGTVLGTIHHIVIFTWLTDLIVNTIKQGGSLNPLDTPALLVPLAVGTILFITLRIIDRKLRRTADNSGKTPAMNK